MDKLVYFFKRLIKPYTDPEFWSGVGANIFWALVLLVFGLFLIKFIHKMIEQFFYVRRRTNLSHSEKGIQHSSNYFKISLLMQHGSSLSLLS